MTNYTSRRAGTTTNDNAAVGMIGEFITATVSSAGAVSLTTATSTNVTSISLTAGDWDVNGVADFILTGATSSNFQTAISLTSATLPTQAGGSGLGTDAVKSVPLITTLLSGIYGQDIMPVRLSLTATSTIYLVVNATFTAGTNSAYGTIRARRIR